MSRRLAEKLRPLTKGRTDMPLVFYCHHHHCWLSYNAALRAIKLGYTNVMWYRWGERGCLFDSFPLEEVKVF